MGKKLQETASKTRQLLSLIIGLGSKERHALSMGRMVMTDDESRMDELKRETARLSALNGKLTLWLVVTGIALACFVLSASERGYIVLGHAIDGSIREEVHAVHSSWWGLRTKSTEIKWVTPTYDRQRGIDFQDWCYQASPGEWVPYFVFMD
jgi:hypothetical protein